MPRGIPNKKKAKKRAVKKVSVAPPTPPDAAPVQRASVVNHKEYVSTDSRSVVLLALAEVLQANAQAAVQISQAATTAPNYTDYKQFRLKPSK